MPLTKVDPKMFGGGAVLQVVSAAMQGELTISSSAFQTITGLTASITPTSSTSKILVCVNLQLGAASTNTYAACKLQRGGADIPGAISTVGGSPTNASWSPLPSYAGQNAGAPYDLFSSSFAYLDSPASSSQQTYSVVVSPMRTSAYTIYVNRSGDTGDSNRRNGVSTITLMEIAG